MTGKEYQEKAMFFRNPEMTKENGLINSVMGLCGEK